MKRAHRHIFTTRVAPGKPDRRRVDRAAHDDAATRRQVAHGGVRAGIHDRQSAALRTVASRGDASGGQRPPGSRVSRMHSVSAASSAWLGALRERFTGGAALSSARERLPGAGSSRSTHAADTRPSASKTTPSDSSSARFRWTAGAAAPHSPLNPPRRRSEAMTRCQGMRPGEGNLRIAAPTDRAQPPATSATAPYVVTTPERRARRRAPWTEGGRHPLTCYASTTQMRHGFERCSTATAHAACAWAWAMPRCSQRRRAAAALAKS